ncbi:MAG: NADPH-dependent glutamate synthase [Bacteroidales bacterium]|nr:NADPH-dependent glutamate synthase [Bacteroidales bacterium]
METTVDVNHRVHPQRQTAESRIHNFDEVSMGYTEEQAKLEASRCLNCKKPRCSMMGCPIHNRIPEFIHQIVEGNYEEAYQIISTRSTLPAVCGRVCPHEQQCEGSCIRGVKGEPISIGNLERFVADWHREHHPEVEVPTIAADAKKVAIIGGGPSGMACAHDLAQMGYRVTLFEAMHEVGGVMIYGIPEFVLPKSVVRHEVEKLRKMGVTIETNVIGGKTVTVDDLMDRQGFEAVYIAAGAGLPRFMGIAGETLNGVMSANELLAKVTMMHANEADHQTALSIGKRVAVIGGGNVAIDAARVARRLGAEVTIVYRRDEENMPARRDEIQLAKEENIALCTQTNPVAFLGDAKGNVCGMRCVRMQMGEPDESGRRSFSVIEGSEFEMPIDNVFLALGSSAIPIVHEGASDVATDRKGLITTDDEGRTSRKGVFAGGDIVSGPQTVVLAMGAGRKAAKAIDQYFRPEAYAEKETEEN